MEIDNIYELNKIIEIAIEYGRGDTYVEVLFDAMDDYLNVIGANNDYSVEESGKYIPQFSKNM